VPRPIRALVVVLVLTALGLSAGSASAEERMWIGFHDDPVLRYGEDRLDELDSVRAANATIVRTLVEWRTIAPTRPRNAANPFDRAYLFADLDELVRNAQVRGMEVLMTIWGTPGWANGNKGPQFLPRRMADFRNFTKALASRYSGRRAGYPFVRFYGIWNESNLGNFLAPQFDARGRIVSPKAYAKLAAAGYAGIKSGSPRALVAVGETSSNGRDRRRPGATDSTTPGTFARLLAAAAPRLKFDAWAQHPYPVPVSQGPAQRVRYPNVTFSTLGRFERDLDRWFKRKNIPIWITEYGNETRPGEPKGVTEGQQARYAPQAIALARRDPRVKMFVWFVFRDSKGSPWQSGVYRPTGAPKPAAARWAAAARGVDMLNGKAKVRAGTAPALTVHLRELCANNAPGTRVGVDARTYLGGRLVHVAQPAATLAFDCTIVVRLAGLEVEKGRTYRVELDANTSTTAPRQRVLTLVGS
jgi:polysaccharide biosynthesis protein PslG